MLSELYKLFELIWQKKKCCDNNSWNNFFLQCTRDNKSEHDSVTQYMVWKNNQTQMKSQLRQALSVILT